MAQGKVGSTDPELLKRVAALWDNPAWGEFFERYDPLVQRLVLGLRPRRRIGRRALPARLGRAGPADAVLSVRPGRFVSRLAQTALPPSRHRPLSRAPRSSLLALARR